MDKPNFWPKKQKLEGSDGITINLNSNNYKAGANQMNDDCWAWVQNRLGAIEEIINGRHIKKYDWEGTATEITIAIKKLFGKNE